MGALEEVGSGVKEVAKDGLALAGSLAERANLIEGIGENPDNWRVYFGLGESDPEDADKANDLSGKTASSVIGSVDATGFKEEWHAPVWYRKFTIAAGEVSKLESAMDPTTKKWFKKMSVGIEAFKKLDDLDFNDFKGAVKNDIFKMVKQKGSNYIYGPNGLFNFLLAFNRAKEVVPELAFPDGVISEGFVLKLIVGNKVGAEAGKKERFASVAVDVEVASPSPDKGPIVKPVEVVEKPVKTPSMTKDAAVEAGVIYIKTDGSALIVDSRGEWAESGNDENFAVVFAGGVVPVKPSVLESASESFMTKDAAIAAQLIYVGSDGRPGIIDSRGEWADSVDNDNFAVVLNKPSPSNVSPLPDSVTADGAVEAPADEAEGVAGSPVLDDAFYLKYKIEDDEREGFSGDMKLFTPWIMGEAVTVSAGHRMDLKSLGRPDFWENTAPFHSEGDRIRALFMREAGKDKAGVLMDLSSRLPDFFDSYGGYVQDPEAFKIKELNTLKFLALFRTVEALSKHPEEVGFNPALINAATVEFCELMLSIESVSYELIDKSLFDSARLTAAKFLIKSESGDVDKYKALVAGLEAE